MGYLFITNLKINLIRIKITNSAAKLVSNTMHLTSKVKLLKEFGCPNNKDTAELLGLQLFHKIHCNILKPLVKSCMPKVSLKVFDKERVKTCI